MTTATQVEADLMRCFANLRAYITTRNDKDRQRREEENERLSTHNALIHHASRSRLHPGESMQEIDTPMGFTIKLLEPLPPLVWATHIDGFLRPELGWRIFEEIEKHHRPQIDQVAWDAALSIAHASHDVRSARTLATILERGLESLDDSSTGILVGAWKELAGAIQDRLASGETGKFSLKTGDCILLFDDQDRTITHKESSLSLANQPTLWHDVCDLVHQTKEGNFLPRDNAAPKEYNRAKSAISRLKKLLKDSGMASISELIETANETSSGIIGYRFRPPNSR